MAERRLREIASAAAAGGLLADAVDNIAQADVAAALQLKALAPILVGIPRDDHRLVHLTSGWFGLLLAAALAIASSKVALALAGAPIADSTTPTIPTLVFSLVVVAYGSMGLVLTVGSQWDERARTLGWLYLLTASFFCNRQIANLASLLGSPLSIPLAWLERTQVDAIAPAAVWLFVARFPESPSSARAQKAAVALTTVTAAIGAFLLVVNLALAAGIQSVPHWVARLDHRRSDSFYYQTAFFSLALVPFVLFAKTRFADVNERRRVAYFCAALALGFAPIVVASILASPWSPISAQTRAHTLQIGVLVYAGLLSVPFTTTWAVAVSRVLDVRFFARAAVRAIATRTALGFLTALPFVFLVRRLYLGRDRTLGDLAASGELRLLLLLFAAGTVLTVLQPRLVEWLNRRMLRRRPEGALAASVIATAVRRSRSRRELGDVIAREVERLYQPEVVSLLVYDSDERSFLSEDGLPPLPAGSGLAYIMDDACDAVSIDPTSGRDLYFLLPAEDQAWITSSRARHILSVRGRDDRLLGLLAVGRRRGDLEFSAEDLRAIAAFSEAAGAVLENLVGEPASGEALDAAWECDRCGIVRSETGLASRTDNCGGTFRAAPVPGLIGGKYRVEQRVGRGGMGTVYRAVDERLKRTVAVKALHRIDRALIEILLSEARLSAALQLPGASQIFAIEEWRGVPILVMEFLNGGTLAERLVSGPLELDEVARIGAALSRSLSMLHGQHIAHRDIKPGNIGFRADGSPCLLDLGLAGDARVRPWERDHVGGTPSYVAPFVLAGSSDYARADAWSLCQTLLEALPPPGAVPEVLKLRRMLTGMRDQFASETHLAGIDQLTEKLDDYLSGSSSKS